MKYPQKISDHITFAEAIRSRTATRLGLANLPDQEQLLNMMDVADKCFEPCRSGLGGKPIYISSFLRTLRVNTSVGGSARSFHVIGAAIDLDAHVFDHSTNRAIFDFFYMGNAPYTELIWEYGSEFEPDWVHVAYLENDNRQMVSRMYWEDGKRVKKEFDLY